MNRFRPKPISFALGAYFFAYALTPHPSARSLELVWGYLLNWIVAEWIIRDSQRRSLHPCYDYDTFLFAIWPLLAPIYLFKTRGLRAFIPIAAFIAMSLTSVAVL